MTPRVASRAGLPARGPAPPAALALLGLALLALLPAPALAARAASASLIAAAAELRAGAAGRAGTAGAGASASASASAAASGGREGREEMEAYRAARVDALRKRGGYTPGAEADLVPWLPGWGRVEGFNLFAGYVTVDEAAGRALFYVFAEVEEGAEAEAQEGAGGQAGAAAADPTPLVLWLNGGPGCSSLGGGFMSELGPWYPTPGGRGLQRNPHAWNAFAHTLFVESPAFVGFSYSNTTADAVVGDARTAADSRRFLLGFLARFPRLRGNPFYISGESYAGHYVPNLALAVVEGNQGAAAGERINLQGFLVGNPWTDTAIDNLGAVDFWWHHALISDGTAAGMRANCNFSRIGPLDAHPSHASARTRDELCDDFCNRAFDELGPINIYEIYADTCDTPPAARRQVEALQWALGRGDSAGAEQDAQQRPAARTLLAAAAAAARPGARGGASTAPGRHSAEPQSHRAARLAARASGDGADPNYDPCVDGEVEDYLNDPEVQSALHANQSVVLPWRWTDCSRAISYSRQDLLSSMLPVYGKLLQVPGLRFLIYSGDVDGIVPVVGTRRWVAGLRLPERDPWRPWMFGQQVGGYVVEYARGLTFASVRGAGHMVPYVQPGRAAHMAAAWLAGRAL